MERGVGVAKLYWVAAFISLVVGIIFSIMEWSFCVALALDVVLVAAWTFYFARLVKRREAAELIALRSDMSELKELKRRSG